MPRSAIRRGPPTKTHHERTEASGTPRFDEPDDDPLDRFLAFAQRFLEVDVAALWLPRQHPSLRPTARLSAQLVAFLQRFGTQVAQRRTPTVIEDCSSDPEDPCRRALAAAGWRSAAAVPIATLTQTTGGALCIVSASPRSWSDQTLRDLRDLASFAGDHLMLGEAIAQAEEKAVLAEGRRSRMLRMLERMTDGFVAIDDKWRFGYLNPSAEQMLGISLTEALGRDVWEVCPLAAEPVFCDGARQAAATGERVIVEGRVPDSERWVEARFFPGADGIAVYLHDTTDRVLASREREARAVAEARLEGVLLASREATHLLNNDIALPMGLVELMQLEEDLSERTRAMLSELAEGLERLHEHLRQFQSIVRVQTKETPLGPALDLSQSAS